MMDFVITAAVSLASSLSITLFPSYLKLWSGHVPVGFGEAPSSALHRHSSAAGSH